MKKNYIYNLALSLSNLLFPIITFPYVSRVLGPAGLGKVQFVISFAQYFTLIAALGIPIYGVQVIAAAKDNVQKLSKVFSELSVVYIISSCVLALVYYCTVLIFSYFAKDNNLFLFAGVMIIFAFTSIDWVYSGLEEFRLPAIRSVLIKSLSLFLLLVFVQNEKDYLSYLLILLFTIQGSHFTNILLARGRVAFTWHNLEIKKHIKPLIFIFSTTLAGSMYTVLDIVILGLLTNDITVGLYAAATKLTRIAIPIIISLSAVLTPRVAMAFSGAQNEEIKILVNKAFAFTALFSVPIAAGLAIFAPEFLAVFSGEKFSGALFSMQILSLLPIVVGLGYLFAFVILIPAGSHRQVFYSVALGLPFFIILNVLLVPKYKEVGESIANICTELIVTLAYFYFLKRKHSFCFDWMLFIKSFLCSLPFIPIAFILKLLELNTLFTLLLAVVSCTFVYMGLQLMVFKNILLNGAWKTVMKKLNFN